MHSWYAAARNESPQGDESFEVGSRKFRRVRKNMKLPGLFSAHNNNVWAKCFYSTGVSFWREKQKNRKSKVTVLHQLATPTMSATSQTAQNNHDVSDVLSRAVAVPIGTPKFAAGAIKDNKSFGGHVRSKKRR